jgi:hypothetical protein
MTRKSEREIKRLLEELAEEYGPDPEFEVTSEVTVVMEREQAEAEGREIVEELGQSTRAVTWYGADGNAVGGSPESKIPDAVDLVAVRPE